MNLTDTYLDRLLLLGAAPIPERVLLQAKQCLLDYLGVTLAGAAILQTQGEAYLNRACPGGGESTVVGYHRKADLMSAVFLNGMSAHTAELDDGHRFGMVHAGAPVISALLPLAQSENLPGDALLRGIVLGYEAAIRLACAIQPGHKEQGFHTTGTCGTIGAAMGAAAMLGLPPNQRKDALSAAATGAGGLLEVISSQLKPFNAARAGVVGLMSTLCVRAGFSGPDDILGGRRGFFQVMDARPDPSALTGEPDSYLIEGIYRKPYASCRHTHAPVEAALRIRQEVSPDEVKNIRVRTYKLAVDGHDQIEIPDSSTAKMSIPYSVAVALVLGRAGIDEFSDRCILDGKVLSLTGVTRVEADDELTALAPGKRAAIVEVTKKSGGTSSIRVDHPKGEPENPISQAELEEKFTSLALYSGKTQAQAEEMIQLVWDVENQLDKLLARL